jgi:aminomethyltransferase
MTDHTRAPYRAPLLTTPFHSRLAPLALANDWLRWGGYTTVDCFSEVETEYFAIRNAATLYDISPMRKYRISGPESVGYMNRLLTRDASKIRPGRAGYAVWCDDGGTVMDDGTIFRFTETEFRLNSQEHQQCWLEDTALGFDVIVEDVSENIAGLALQGPLSCAVLKQLGLDGVADLKPFDIKEYPFEGDMLTVTRTGFTGDLGYELWVAPAMAETLWDSSRPTQISWPPKRLHTLAAGGPRSSLAWTGWSISTRVISMAAAPCCANRRSDRATESSAWISLETSRPTTR